MRHRDCNARMARGRFMKELRSPSMWCRLFGCQTFGPYYGMPQSHCWNCGMKTRYARRDLNLPDFVKPGKLIR